MLSVIHIKTSEIRKFSLPEFHETIVVMPCIRLTLARRAADVMAGRTEQPALLVLAEDDCRLGFIATANFVYAKTRSRFFGYVAQDAFAGYYWLEQALKTLGDRSAGLLAFNDGRFFGRLAAFGLADRAWLDPLYGGFLFYPHYNRNYADTELSDLAISREKMVYNPHSMMIEIDYGKHRGKSESGTDGKIVYDCSADDADGILYVRRALEGFDGKISPFVPELGPVEAVLAARARRNALISK